MALAAALVLDLVDHHPAREVGPGHAPQRAAGAFRQRFEVLGELLHMAVEDRRHDGERVRLAGDVAAHRSCWIDVSMSSYATLNASGSSEGARARRSSSAAATLAAEMISVVVAPEYAL